MHETATQETLSPLHKAAILLLAMGADEAAKVLEHLEPREVQRVGAALSALGGIATGDMDAVVDHFLEAVSGEPGPTLGANDYLKRLLLGAVRERPSRPLRARARARRPLRVDGYRWTNARAIAGFLTGEPTQLQAMVLAYLRPARAALVLQALPPDVRLEVLMQLARLDVPAADGLAVVAPLAQAGFERSTGPDGPGRTSAGEIVALLNEGDRRDLLVGLANRDPALATALGHRDD